jgi:hypothetical protein
MNSYERKAFKRAKQSQAKWKQKAIERNKRLRAAHLKIRDLEKSRQMWRERYETAQEAALAQERSFPPC